MHTITAFTMAWTLINAHHYITFTKGTDSNFYWRTLHTPLCLHYDNKSLLMHTIIIIIASCLVLLPRALMANTSGSMDSGGLLWQLLTKLVNETIPFVWFCAVQMLSTLVKAKMTLVLYIYLSLSQFNLANNEHTSMTKGEGRLLPSPIKTSL